MGVNRKASSVYALGIRRNLQRMGCQPSAVRLWPLLFMLLPSSASHADQDPGNEAARLIQYDPPRITPKDEEMVLSSGESLRLQCESKKPIKWTTPMHKIAEDGLADINVNFAKNISSDYPYISYLEVFHLNVTDTGYYYCRFEENVDLNAVEEVANIYVYVNDSEALLVAKQYFIHLTSIQYHEVTIPCKPTAPDVNVTLSKDEEIISVNESGFIYDPREGFINRYPAVVDSGVYTCNAERGNISQSFSVVLIIHTHTNEVPKPNIDDKSIRHVVVGNDFRLDCTVRMELSVIFNLEWSTPNQIANETGRLQIGDAISSKIKQNNYEYVLGSKYLIVHNVTSDDQGYYRCTVVDHTHKEKSDEKFVRVFEADITYINFTVQGNVPEIKAKAGDKSVQWVVHVAAHPYPQLIWYDPKEKEIQNLSSKYEIHSEPTQTKLKINDIDMSDAGQYQLKGINREVEKTLNLTLIVYDAPTVELTGQMYYMYGQRHTINCSVIGFPVPNVTWHFKGCGKSFQICDEKAAKIDATHYKEVYLNGKGRKTSVLEIKAIKSGLLTCFACNTVRCESETINFFVTDILNGFDANVMPADPVVGDNVTLSCGASVYNYTDSVDWYKYNPANSNYELITNGSGYQVIPAASQFSRKVDIKIYNINMTHAGTYICKVEKIADDLIEEEEVKVTVQKIQEPSFVNTSMNGSYYYADPGAKVEWKCVARGVPKPSVIWYKDGKLLKVEKQKMELSNGNQTLKITYATFEDEGKYSCKVTNKGGVIEGSMTLALNYKRALSDGVLIGLMIFGAILTIVVIFLIVKNQKEKKLRKELMFAGLANFEDGALENINPELGVDDQAELLPYDKKWEFPREKLKLGKQLGSGAFGVVMKADAYGIVEGEALTTVAVKMVKRNAEYTHIRALASELKIMVHLGKHLNVVNLLGACTKNLTKRELLVIVEYCRFGNLQNYLLRHREDFIDQIDPSTGKVVPEGGMENDMETSTSKAREAVKGDPGIKYAALSFSTSASSVESQGSVLDYRAAPLVKEDRALCNGITGQTVNTDMSLVSMSPSGEECGVTGGSSSEPDWRTNYRGDYGRRDVRPICTSDLICWAFQVARGIDYLASRRVLHGDLAARNILLAEDNVVKICDFGLAKSMYKSDNYKKKGDGPLPVKWMAIESIRDRVFSTQSDVWSFGIVLWEFFSLARTPYPGMEADEKLYNKLIAGYRMEKPQYATDEIYSVMLDCWKGKPSERPTFTDLTEKLGGMLEETVKRHYIDLNSPYLTMNDQQQETTDYLGMMSEPSYTNAMREATPQREYVNTPTQPENPALDYMTMRSPDPQNEEDGAESESGYLCMRKGSVGNGGSSAVIFSPRPNPTQTFNFEMLPLQNAAKLPPKLRTVETEGAEGPEMSPMLPLSATVKNASLQKEDSLDSGMGSPNSYFNPTYRSLPNTNGHASPNNEIAETNYINIPQSKARQSDRSSGFQSDGGELSPLPHKNLSSFEIPLKMST